VRHGETPMLGPVPSAARTNSSSQLSPSARGRDAFADLFSNCQNTLHSSPADGAAARSFGLDGDPCGPWDRFIARLSSASSDCMSSRRLEIRPTSTSCQPYLVWAREAQKDLPTRAKSWPFLGTLSGPIPPPQSKRHQTPPTRWSRILDIILVVHCLCDSLAFVLQRRVHVRSRCIALMRVRMKELCSHPFSASIGHRSGRSSVQRR
jgi:hypothetical protein